MSGSPTPIWPEGGAQQDSAIEYLLALQAGHVMELGGWGALP